MVGSAPKLTIKDLEKAMNEINVIEAEKQMPILTVDTKLLRRIFDCSTVKAYKIGEQAHAKIKIGGRVLWHIKSVKNYIERRRRKEERELIEFFKNNDVVLSDDFVSRVKK